MARLLRVACWAAVALAAVSAEAAAGPAAGRPVLNVLFVGNSIGTYWKAPAWIGEIAQSLPGGPTLKVEVSDAGAVENLNAHLSRTYGSKGLVDIRRGGWNLVVLQENPYEPLQQRERFSSAVSTLVGEARKTGAEVVLFEPFALAAGSVVYSSEGDWSGGSPSSMQSHLRQACDLVAGKLSLRQARVGDAFGWVAGHHPEIPLYENDKIHPSPCGAFLAACVIARLLTGGDPRDSTWLPPMGVTAAQARSLRAASCEFEKQAR